MISSMKNLTLNMMIQATMRMKMHILGQWQSSMQLFLKNTWATWSSSKHLLDR